MVFPPYGKHNGCESWEEKESNLPDMPIRWAIYHPAKATSAMLATEMGVWTTYNLEDDSVNWIPDNTGLANVRIDMLQLRDADNTVLAGTHGRGLYTTTYNYYNPTTQTPERQIAELNIYPNPTTGKVNIYHKINENKTVNIDVYNVSSVLVRSFQQRLSDNKGSIDISDLASGNYILKLRAENTVKVGKIIKK